MADERNLIRIINKINQNLNSYLSKCPYKIINNKTLEKSFYPQNMVSLDDNRSIILTKSIYGRNPALTLLRVKNILSAQEQINKIRDQYSKLDANQEKVDTSKINNDANKIKKILNQHLNLNSNNSADNLKEHNSYRDNRLRGLGVVISFFKQTCFQSRAADFLGKSIDEIEEFMSTFHIRDESPAVYCI